MKVSFKFTDKQFCIFMVIINIIVYSLYAIFVSGYIKNEAIDDMAKTILTTLISIFMLSFLLEVSSLKKLIIAAIDESFGKVASIASNKDLSIYNEDELKKFSDEIIIERFKNFNAPYREKAIESVKLINKALMDDITKYSFRNHVHIVIQYELLEEGIKYTFTETYKLYHYSQQYKFQEERWLSSSGHRDAFNLTRLIINSIDHTESACNLFQKDRLSRHSSYGLKYELDCESPNCCFEIFHEYSYIKTLTSPFCYRFKDYIFDVTVQLKVTNNDNQKWKPYLYALSQTNNTKELVSKDGNSIQISIDGWSVPGSGICFGVYNT